MEDKVILLAERVEKACVLKWRNSPLNVISG